MFPIDKVYELGPFGAVCGVPPLGGSKSENPRVILKSRLRVVVAQEETLH